MIFHDYQGLRPTIAENAHICEGVVLTGDVQVGEQASIWYGTVARGDINKIVIGPGSNIQDGSVLHVDDDHPCLVGSRVVVGHMVCLHGTTVENESLIGIGAKLLNGSVVREGAMVAAGTVVPEGFEVPAGMVAMGVPAKVRRPVTDSETAMIRHLADKYINVSRAYQASGSSQSQGSPS